MKSMLLSHIPLNLDLLPGRKGVYIVGGSTRDLLLGSMPADYDIAVSQNPEIFARMTADRFGGRLVVMGHPGKRSFRVIAGSLMFDITGLSGSSIQEDLEHRDVTINAMAVHLDDGVLVDPVGGRADLAGRRIRMVSENGLREDPLRLLRIFRLAAGLTGFSIESRTLSAIRRNAHLISRSAGERVRSELHKLLSCPDSFSKILEMADTGLLSALFPELVILQGKSDPDDPDSDLCRQVLASYRSMEAIMHTPPERIPSGSVDKTSPLAPDQAAWLKFAILLHPIGSLPCEGVSVETVCRRFRLSKKEQNLIVRILRYDAVPFRLYENETLCGQDPRKITRFFIAGGEVVPHILLRALAEMDALEPDGPTGVKVFSDFIEKLLGQYYGFYLVRKSRPPFLTGNDLAEIFKLPPSPSYQKILALVEEARLSGELVDRDAALILAGEILHDMAACQP